MFPENITHYPGYDVYYFPTSRNVFMLRICTEYIVRVCLLSFIKIIYTYIYMHTYMLLEIDFHSVLLFLMLLRVM